MIKFVPYKKIDGIRTGIVSTLWETRLLKSVQENQGETGLGSSVQVTRRTESLLLGNNVTET